MMAYISAEIERSREIFIKHHRVKYGGHVPPVWVVVEVMSFGGFIEDAQKSAEADC